MNADDPKFTAHALGELEDLTPAERAEIEALLANDPNAAAEAAETQALAARLRAELPGETAAALGAEQRAAVFKAAAAAVPNGKVVRFPRRTMVLSVIAACAVVGISIGLIMRLLQMPGALLQSPVNLAETPASPTVSVDPLDAPPPTPPSAEISSASTTTQALPGIDFNLAGTGRVTLAQNGPSSALPRLQVTPDLTPPPPPVFAATSPNRPHLPKLGTLIANPQNKTASSPTMLASAAPHPRAQPVELQLQKRDFDTGVGLVEQDSQPGYAFMRPIGPHKSIVTDSVSTRSFEGLPENTFLPARENPLSTFSIDVDTASYAIVRRMLNDNQRPPSGAVRIEELLNYFPYDYPQPKGDAPFSATMEVAACPWAPEHRLVRIGLKGREIPKDQRPPSNLVFLIDVSGSMNMPNKLPLLKQSLSLLIDQLREQDQVSIVVYAGNSGCVLNPTHDKSAMREAISRLEAGGSTNGASGIQLAYQIAEKAFIKDGTNRVILATDGDWNVGITNQDSLLEMIARKAKSGVFLTVLGFGMDNLKDTMLVKLADRGNGNYAYIDTLLEARKVFVEQLSSTLVTIAKDVKIQVEFNPAQVGAYRLIGYEKRLLAKEDFNNDKKDAGEIGAGHTVTALYEVVPAGQEVTQVVMVDKLKYQSQAADAPAKKKEATLEPEQRKDLPAAPAAPAAAPASPAAPELEEVARPDTKAELQPVPKSHPIPHAIPVEKPATDFTQGENAVAAPTGGESPARPAPSPMTAKGPHKTIIADNSDGNGRSQAVAQVIAAPAVLPAAAVRNEMLTLKLRYKAPDGDKSKLLEFPLTDPGTAWEKSSPDFHFAAAVAGYGMLLRDSTYQGETTWQSVTAWAHEGLGADASGYRTEFLGLLEKAQALAP